MALSVQAIVDARRERLLQRWVDNPALQVQVESPTALGRLAFIDDSVEAEPGQLGRRSAGMVALVPAPPGYPDHAASVWVAAEYKSYRAAFKAFLKTNYGVSASGPGLAPYDVDHLLNKARSPKPGTFIRIEAVPREINQLWGATFEKAASHPDDYANRERERRTMSCVIAAKLAGERPPSGPGDQAGFARIAARFVRYGLDRAEMIGCLSGMHDFAYRDRG